MDFDTSVGADPARGLYAIWLKRRADAHHRVAYRKNTYLSDAGSRVQRKKLFLLSSSETLQPWAPALGRLDPEHSPLGVWMLCAAGPDALCAGGDFSSVNGKEQQRFARFPRP